MPEFVIRPMSKADIDGAVGLQRDCFPDPFPVDLLWSVAHLTTHLEVFPKGQFVALAAGAVVASASSCIVTEEAWKAHAPWEATIGGPFIRNHDPNGSTLYGLDLSVHPAWRGLGVMRALYSARFDLVRSSGLARYGTAVRIPGFDAYRLENANTTPEDYVEAVANGYAVDRTLTPMLRVGLEAKGVIRNYMADVESHNAAAVLEWRP
jgi:GNAT superfamily N-acetyltransferase